MKFKSVLAAIGMFVCQTHAGEGALVGSAQHIGTRRSQEDRCISAQFKVNDINYSLAVVCDGHGGEFASKYVKQTISKELESSLKNCKTPQDAILAAFATCEAGILRQQPENKTVPGTTVILSLWDLSNRKKYIGNLGDSRLYTFKKDGTEKYKTEDHSCKNSQERQYVSEHGGVVKIVQKGSSTQTGVFPADERKAELVGGIEPTRALGDKHLKFFTASDGTVGPINPVPQILEYAIEDNEIEMLVTDGYTKLADPCYQASLQDCWPDIWNAEMSQEDFEAKYAHSGGFGNDGNAINIALKVRQEHMVGDEALSRIAARIIYALRYMDENAGTSDNVTTLLRMMSKQSNDRDTEVKQKLNSSIFNPKIIGGALFIGLLSFLLYYRYGK